MKVTARAVIILALVVSLTLISSASYRSSRGTAPLFSSDLPVRMQNADKQIDDLETPTIGQAFQVANVAVNNLPAPNSSPSLTQPSILTPSGSAVSTTGVPKASPSSAASVSSSSVSESTGFDGLSQIQSGGAFPPDVQAASGPNHVMEMVNLAGEVFSKQGSVVKSPFSLASFFSTGSDCLSDPKVLFDSSSGRWFASIIDVTARNVTLAVSATNDPTGTWKIYAVKVGNYLPDQPIIGVSDDKFVASANDFQILGGNPPFCTSIVLSFPGAQFWILNKSEMVEGSATVDFSSFGPNPNLFSVHPVQSLSPTNTQYLVEAGIGFQFGTIGTTNAAQVFSITGTPPGTVVVHTVSLTLSSVAAPPPAAQPGTSNTVNPDDARVEDAAWFQGKLWFTFNDGCTPPGDTLQRSCIHLTEIDTTTFNKVQDFDFGANSQYYFYGALRIDAQGNLAVIYGYSSATNSTCCFPSLAVTGQAVSDPAGSLASPQTLKRGSAIDSSNPSRYGDYFGAGVDPSDPALIWVAGEYHTNTTGTCGPGTGNCWSTFIGGIRVVVGPDFGVDPNPGSFIFAGGASGTSTIALTSLMGFAGTVSLSTSVSPPGPGASLTSTSIGLSAGGSATSMLSVSTASSLAAGAYTIAVTAAGGGLRHSALVTVNIPGFIISANPGNFSLATRSSATSALTVTSLNGFTGSLTLTASVSPSGPSLSVSPSSLSVAWGASGASTLTVSASRSTPAGLYTVMMTGTGGSQSTTVLIPVAVTPLSVTINNSTTFTGVIVKTTGTLSVDSPSNTLTVSGPASVVATNATTGATLFSKTYTIATLPVRASGGGFRAMFLLNVALLPYPLTSNVVITFSGTTTGVSVAVTRAVDIDGNGLVDQPDLNILLAALNCSLGSACYNPKADLDADGTVDFNDASLLAFYFSAQDYLPNYAISASPNSLTIPVGSPGTGTITLTSVNGFAVTVNLAAPVSPSGLTASLSPTSLTMKSGGSASSTLTVESNAVGTFTVNVTGTSGPLSHSVLVTVTVVDFSLFTPDSLLSIPPGTSFNEDVLLLSINGFAGTVKLTASVTPSGLKASFNTTSVTLTVDSWSDVILTLTSAKSGCYSVTITGTSGSLSHTTFLTVNSNSSKSCA